MPIYVYECQQCGERFEYSQSLSEPKKTVCEKCGGALEKIITPTAFHLKGGGWYKDSYSKSGGGGDKTKKAEAKSESTDSSSSSSASSESKGETKTETKTETKSDPKPSGGGDK